jgi:hypothetical protein
VYQFVLERRVIDGGEADIGAEENDAGRPLQKAAQY